MSYNDVFAFEKSASERIIYTISFNKQDPLATEWEIASVVANAYAPGGEDVSADVIDNEAGNDNEAQFTFIEGDPNTVYAVDVHATMTTGEVVTASGTVSVR